MSNDYYTAGSQTAFTKARASGINTETDAVEAAFDLLPSLAEMRSGNTTFVVASGTANAITVTHPIQAWTTYTGKNGHKLSILITAANTSSVTVAIDGLATKAAKRVDGAALQDGDLPLNSVFDFIYYETGGYWVVPNIVNGFLDDVEEQVTIASAMTNFIGLWSAQTGAKTVPTAVYHLGSFWALTSNIADITAKVPGTATEWVLIDSGISYAGMTGAVNAPAVCIHSGDFWRLITNSSDITTDVPGVSAKWEKVDKTVYKPVVNYQEFLASGTWTKPTGNYTVVYVEDIGGGGSGGLETGATGTGVGGGGGGEFVCRILPIADCGATETVTVGAGGAAVTATGAGNNGGSSTFGSLVTARGGKGGHATGVTDLRTYCAGGDGVKQNGGYGAGAGGRYDETGYNCTMGGAGGGGANGSNEFAGGTAQRGGNGGTGKQFATATAGTQPGGGGGGCYSNNSDHDSGAGAAGRVRVWCW